MIKQILSKHEDLFGKNPVYKEIGSGENHTNYKIGKYVLRISRSKWADLPKEFESLKKLPNGLGPKPIYLGKNYLILSYVEGKHVYRWRDKHVKQVAREFKRIHKKKYEYTTVHKRKTKCINILKLFQEEVKEYKSSLKDPYVKIAYNLLKKRNQQINNVSAFSQVHGDPNIPNILFSKEGAKFIDFEWAKISDPASDIGSLYRIYAVYPWNPKFTDEKLNFFLKEYGNTSREFKERVCTWNILHVCLDYLFFSWMISSKREMPKNMSNEYYVNGKEKAMKTLKHFQNA